MGDATPAPHPESIYFGASGTSPALSGHALAARTERVAKHDSSPDPVTLAIAERSGQAALLELTGSADSLGCFLVHPFF